MLSLYIQISEEEDPAGYVMEGPSPSVVTDKMSGDVDPVDHVPNSGPPPDQISAVSHISLMFDWGCCSPPSTSSICVILWVLRVTVTDFSIKTLPLPQDEEYTCQLQSELDPVLNVQRIYEQISAVSHTLLFVLIVHVNICDHACLNWPYATFYYIFEISIALNNDFEADCSDVLIGLSIPKLWGILCFIFVWGIMGKCGRFLFMLKIILLRYRVG